MVVAIKKMSVSIQTLQHSSMEKEAYRKRKNRINMTLTKTKLLRKNDAGRSRIGTYQRQCHNGTDDKFFAPLEIDEIIDKAQQYCHRNGTDSNVEI